MIKDDERVEMIARLRNPMWVHSQNPFTGPQLAKEETLADLKEAADEIERLAALLPAPVAWQGMEALQAVADFMRKDVQSGDSDLWTPEYEALHDQVIVALVQSPPAPLPVAGEREET